VKGERLKG